MGTVLLPTTQKTENQPRLYNRIESLNQECKTCKPITPFQCINRCRIYKIKNELRHLQETMKNPNYIEDLFNSLKNETRYRTLKVIVGCGGCSASRIQQELKKTGTSYDQYTLCEEYLHPLLKVGLIIQVRDKYQSTTFGERITELLAAAPEFTSKMSSNSKGYEEAILEFMLSGPKTFEDIEVLIQPKNMSRSLRRLISTGLIKTPKERDYVFYFKTIRDPKKETLTKSEQKIYETLGKNGISATKLAKATGLSLRRTYKHLRHLKYKKLVFPRTKPKPYELTCEGKPIAILVQGIKQTVLDTWNSSQQIIQTSKAKPEWENISVTLHRF